jgi:hypothetical protein
MTDPHVVWLEYEMRTAFVFDNPPPLHWHTLVFDADLKDALVRMQMLSHFATEAEARTAVEPFLRMWEIDIALANAKKREVTFEFRQGQVVDRNPPPPGSTVSAMATMTGVAAIAMAGQVTKHSYPAVPTYGSPVPDVLSLWNRFEGFTNGREPLPSMAYFCFTVIKSRYGNIDAARKALAVDKAVFSTLSTLSTNRGDALTARKITADLRPLENAETEWLKSVIPSLIRQVWVAAAGGVPTRLSMNHLPPL